MRPERIPMARETIFDLASLTKPIATDHGDDAAASSEGALGLDDPVAKVPARTSASATRSAVTLRHLLTHASGLQPWRGFHEPLLERERKKGERLHRDARGERELDPRAHLPLGARARARRAPPSTAISTSSCSARWSRPCPGRSLEEFCAERVFGPLGMRDTRLRAHGDGAPPLPDARAPALRRDRELPVARPHRVGRGARPERRRRWAASRATRACSRRHDDVMRFAQAVLDAWHGRGDALPAAGVARASPDAPEPTAGLGLGARLGHADARAARRRASSSRRQSVGHLGFTGISLWIDLEREAVVVMLTNRVHLVAKRSKFGLRPIVHDLMREGSSRSWGRCPGRTGRPRSACRRGSSRGPARCRSPGCADARRRGGRSG